MTSNETLELLRSAVSMRVQGREVPERVRRELAMVEATLIGIIGPLVRKRIAAKLLGCSVQALDRWIAKGALPVEPVAEGATRMGLPTEAVVGVAAELAWLTGEAPLGRAVVGWRERQVRHFEIRDANQLNIDLHLIAQGARRRTA